MPYQVFGVRSGAVFWTIAWIRSAFVLSGSSSEAILSRTDLSAAAAASCALSSLAR